MRIQTVGLRLAWIEIRIKDEILNTEELAAELTGFLVNSYPDVLKEKYEIEESADGFENLREDRRRADIVL